MSTGKILITGATGDTGGYAIEQLLQKGHQVRALVHRIDDRSKRLEDKGVEAVAGDYLDLDAMRAAVKGVRRAYFVYPIRPGIIQATAYFAQAAKEAGVEAIVNMSQISARERRREPRRPGPLGRRAGFRLVGDRRHAPAADVLRRVAPVQCPRRSRRGHSPRRSGPANMHRSRPRTRPASSWGSSRIRPRTAVRSTRCSGRREYTQAEIAQALSRVLGKDVRYKQVTMRGIAAAEGVEPVARPGPGQRPDGLRGAGAVAAGRAQGVVLAAAHPRGGARPPGRYLRRHQRRDRDDRRPPAHVAGGLHREAPQGLRVRRMRRSG